MVAIAWVTVSGSALVGCGTSDDQEARRTTAATAESDVESTDTSTTEATETTVAAATTEWPTVPSPALDGNLLGDPAELRVAVWLPPSYAVTDDDYPVVYFLAGFDEDASVAPIGQALEDAIASGDAPETIVVGVSGRNSLGGSFYVDSPVTGGWATAVHRDLVAWVDDHYRTRPEPASRVIAGFSMGGFGAFDLAMRHPDVFGSVYALSPGALAPGGMADMEMFATDAAIASYLEMEAALASGADAPVLTGAAGFALAYGSAFAPDVDAGPPWVEYPFSEPGGEPDPEAWARWEAGFGGIDVEIPAHVDELASLGGIALDVGTEDPYSWIPDGTRHLAETLEAAGIPVQYTTYPGGHGPVSARAAETMIPFLADVLAADG